MSIFFRINYHFLLWIIRKQLDNLRLQSIGSATRYLTLGILNDIQIPLPVINEQNYIAEILQNVDETVKKVNELLTKYENLKKGLLQQLLTNGIGHTEFKETKLGRIPEEWEVVKLGDIVKIVLGGTPSTLNQKYWNGEIPWATPTDITKLKEAIIISKTKRNISKIGLNESSANLLPIGTILVTTRATIGYCAINVVPMSTNQGFKSLICNEKIHNYFLYFLINHLKPKLDKMAAGSTFKEISTQLLRMLLIPLPSIQEQKKILEILLHINNRIIKEIKYKNKLSSIKKGLMQQLLTGKIRVKE